MGQMGDAVYGGMLVMFLEKERLDAALVRSVCNAIRKHGHLPAAETAAFQGEKNVEWLSRMITKVVEGGQWSLILNWEPSKDGPRQAGAIVQYAMDIQDPDRLSFDGLACFRVYTITQHMPPIQGPRTGIMVETFKDVVKAVRPRFALLDVHHEFIAKRKGKDPRRFAWGAAYYDAAHTKAIGLEALHSSAAIIKEEWPGGGFWLQTWANPFIVAKELTDQIALDLGLKGARFPGSVQSSKVPKSAPKSSKKN